MILFISNGAFAGSTRGERMEKRLAHVEYLLSRYVSQQERDRSQIIAIDQCYATCRSKYGPDLIEGNPLMASEREACFDQCHKLPGPPGGC